MGRGASSIPVREPTIATIPPAVPGFIVASFIPIFENPPAVLGLLPTPDEITIYVPSITYIELGVNFQVAQDTATHKFKTVIFENASETLIKSKELESSETTDKFSGLNSSSEIELIADEFNGFITAVPGIVFALKPGVSTFSIRFEELEGAVSIGNRLLVAKILGP